MSSSRRWNAHCWRRWGPATLVSERRRRAAAPPKQSGFIWPDTVKNLLYDASAAPSVSGGASTTGGPPALLMTPALSRRCWTMGSFCSRSRRRGRGYEITPCPGVLANSVNYRIIREIQTSAIAMASRSLTVEHCPHRNLCGI
jgi:hypothetical protein